MAHLRGLAEDALRLLDGEVAHGVEDPEERETQLARGPLAGALQALQRWARRRVDRSCATCR